jgi:hypothetical protein
VDAGSGGGDDLEGRSWLGAQWRMAVMERAIATARQHKEPTVIEELVNAALKYPIGEEGVRPTTVHRLEVNQADVASILEAPVA